MTRLEDLPSEILTRLPSGHQFSLQNARVYDAQWKADRVTIAALALTCRQMHAVFVALLYRSIIITNLSIANRMNLLRTLISRPHLGGYIEDLKLDVFAQKYPLRDSTIEYDEESSPSDQASDGDWYRLLGYLFFPNTPNLKQLAVRCTRFERNVCEFPELINAHIQGYCQGRGLGLEQSGVSQLLLAPKLVNLILSGPYISDAGKLEDRPSSSNVSSLSLRVVMLSPESLRTILRMPRNLDTFEFYSASMRAPFLEARTRDKFITFKQIRDALRYQKDNLGSARICFPSSDADLPHSIFGGLSFNDFGRLTKLSIAPEMFLGWKVCVHQNPNADKEIGPPEPITFADCLPHCIEELTIFVQQYQRARNGNNYAYDVVRGVLKERRRLYKLRLIELTCCKGVISCSRCRLQALAYLDRSPTIKRDEIFRISDMCEQASIQFNWVEGVWENE